MTEHLYLVIDFGASATKGVGALDANRYQPFFMPPSILELVRVPSDLTGEPIDRAWIKVGDQIFAVGNLAQRLGEQQSILKSLKVDIAVQKTLAAVWVMSQAGKLSNTFELSLSCLLPGGEFVDRDLFITKLKQALRSFDTPSGKLKVKLSFVNVFPEGFAISQQFFRSGRNSTEGLLTTLMLGYRNASILNFQNGQFVGGKTSDLGMSVILDYIVSYTSGYTIDELVAPVASYRLEGDNRALEVLLKKHNQSDRQEELATLVKEIDFANRQYLIRLRSWLNEVLPDRCDQVLTVGGTAEYLGDSLAEFWKEKRIQPLNFSMRMPDEVRSLMRSDRFLEVWCLWLQLQNRK